MLRSKKSRKGVKTQKILNFIERVKYGVFGLLLPSEEESDKQQLDIPDLESEESAAQR